MGDIYNEFVEELRVLAAKFEHRPDQEMDALLHIALEREELVTTAYRANFLQSNIDRLPISKELKSIIRHASVWIWKDEDMHTIYTRGALLKSTSRFDRLQVLLHQFQGFIGGWSSSIIQHLRWKQAPFAVTAARLIIALGKSSGKIPKGIEKELKFGSFKNYCHFNIDAEKTALICWERILLLAQTDARFTENQLQDFQKIIFDETRHQQIFQLIHDLLNADDSLKEGVELKAVIEQVKSVSDYFLPKEFREANDSWLGTKAPVRCIENRLNEDKISFFIDGLERTELKADLTARATKLGVSIGEMKVVIKATFSMGYSHEDDSPINDSRVVEALSKYLYDLGVRQCKVIDIDCIYEQFFSNRSVNELATYFGFESRHYEVINASRELEEHQFTRGIGNYRISKTWKDADFRLNLGKLRSHPIEMALLSINNVEWLTGNTKEFVFLDRIVDRATTTSMLLDDFPPDFNIIEAHDNVPDGILGVMGSKSPIAPLRFYFGRDALSLDIAVIKHLGHISVPSRSSLQNAMHWFGRENLDVEVIGVNTNIKNWKSPTQTLWWTLLSFLSYPVYQFFSARGQLFVPKMDETAFPPISPPVWWIRLLRRLNRTITNLPN